MVTILVIDNNNILDPIKATIGEWLPGSILYAANGIENAIHLSLLNNPQIILLSLDQGRGIEICRTLKNNPKLNHIALVFITTLTDTDQDRLQAFENGADAFLSSPVNRYEVIALFRLLVKTNETNVRPIVESSNTDNVGKGVQGDLAQYQMLLDAAPDAFFHGDNKGNFIGVNKMAREITGYSKSELLTMNISALFDPEILKSAPLRYDYLKQGYTLKSEREITRKDGQKRVVEMNSTAVADGTFQSFMRDVTQRKVESEQLRKSEEKYRNIFENIHDVYYEASISGEILEVSPSVEVLSQGQLKREELIGHSVADLFVDSIQRIRFISLLTKQGYVSNFEMLARMKEGKNIPCLVSAKCLDKTNGSTSKVVGSINNISSQKMSFEIVQNERRLLRTLIDNIPYAIYVKDLEARKLIANSADIKIMNCSSEEAYLGKTDPEIFGVDIGDGGFQEDMTVIKTGHPMLNKEDLYYDTEGEGHWRLISKYPLFDQDGKLTGVLGIGQDITKQKKADEALKESQALYHSFVEHLPVSVFRKDYEGRYEFINSRFCVLKGLSADEILGKTPIELARYESLIEAKRKPQAKGVQRTLANEGADHHKMILETGKTIELEEIYPQPDGRTFYYQVVKTPVFSSKGKVVGSQGIQFDITKRKLDEKAFKESSELNSSLLKAIPFGIDIVDKDGNILFLNDKLIDLFGSNVIGKKCWELHTDKQLQCRNCPLLKDFKIGEKSIYETERVFGGRIFQISHIGMLFNGQKALLEVFQDVTERKQSEIELVVAKDKAEESDRLKSAFLANMSHEIRTPLNCILGFSELMADPDADVSLRSEYNQLINVSGNNLLYIINDIIDISKIEAGQIEINKSTFSPQKLIAQIYSEFEFAVREKGIQLIIQSNLPAKYNSVVSDEAKVRQVLINFISNALKFTEKGTIEIGLGLKGNHIEFHVIDTGIGIPQKYHTKIFERFRQTEAATTRKYGGNGLGLAISKNLIELLGGEIGVESVEGKGARFYFTLNLSSENLKTPS